MDDELRKRSKSAAGAIFFVGGLSLALGLIAVLLKVQFLKSLGIGIWSVFEGGLFLFLGYLVKNGNVPALWVALGLYSLEVIYGIVSMVKANQPSGVGGLFVRGYLLYAMYRGIGAVGQQETPLAPTMPTIELKPRNTPPPRLTGEAERRRMEMSALSQIKVDRPAQLPGQLNRFNVSAKDAVATAASSLRFVIYRCEISARGLKALYSNGSTRELEWMNIALLSVRQLPPDKPWDGKIILDIVPVSPPGFPLPPFRVFASTYVNYAALPGGQAANTQENIRRLAAYTASQNPSLILDPHSAPFIREHKPPYRLTLAQFAEYDQRYPDRVN